MSSSRGIKDFLNVCHTLASNSKVIGIPSTIIDTFILPHINTIFASSGTDIGFLGGIIDKVNINPELKLSCKYVLALVQFGLQYKLTKNLLVSYNETLGKVGCPSIVDAIGGITTLFRDMPTIDETFLSIDEDTLSYYITNLKQVVE